jgi:SAM-dependent methyltransferase
MTSTHESVVAGQFGPQAQAYVASAVHAAGADLDWMADQLRGHDDAELIDIGCGGGHVSYRAAAHVRSVTACDLSNDMLQAVQATTSERGLSNVRTHIASVERLPFSDSCFDIAATRFSAHHWTRFDQGLRQAARVLKPGGMFLIVDGRSPDHPLLDTHLQAIELLRDPSHVRNYGLVEWAGALARAGFVVEEVRTSRVWLEFTSWTARMRTPEVAVKAIQYLQAHAPDEVRRHFEIGADSSFYLDTIWLRATKA